jgi:hypothetical protein
VPEPSTIAMLMVSLGVAIVRTRTLRCRKSQHLACLPPPHTVRHHYLM